MGYFEGSIKASFEKSSSEDNGMKCISLNETLGFGRRINEVFLEM